MEKGMGEAAASARMPRKISTDFMRAIDKRGVVNAMPFKREPNVCSFCGDAATTVPMEYTTAMNKQTNKPSGSSGDMSDGQRQKAFKAKNQTEQRAEGCGFATLPKFSIK